MFTITQKQLNQLASGRLEKAVKSTWNIAEQEFTEFLTGTQEENRNLIRKQVHKGYYQYQISSFDALEDFGLLSLQYKVLQQEKLPADLSKVLEWPDLPDAIKIDETEKLLMNNY
jgi:hypothetical protein